MLDKFRSHVKGWLGMTIIVAISLSFILLGVQSYTPGGDEASLAEVAGTKIYQEDVNRAYRRRVNQLKDQYGDDYSADLFNEDSLRLEALNQLVQEQLIVHTIRQDGYAVSDKTVLDTIANFEAFHKDGKFDKEIYQQLLQAKGQSSAGFVEQVKVGLERDQFINSVVATTLVDDVEILDFYRLNNQEREIRYVTLPMKAVVENIRSTNQEVADSYSRNEHLFKTDETISIDYVELKLSNLMDEVVATDEELKAFYENEKQAFTVEGKRRASHILLEAPSGTSEEESESKRAMAESVLKRIKAGEDFAALAKEFSDDIGSSASGGDLGIVSAGLLEPVLEKPFLRLQEGEVTDVIQSQYGFQIVKLTELVPSKVESFETAKDKVEQLYKQKIAGEKFYQLGERLTQLSFENPDSLDVITDELDLVVLHHDALKRDMPQAKTAEKTDDFASNDKVLHAAFSEDVLAGNNSEPVEVDENHFMVLRVTKHQPSMTEPLENVRGAVNLMVKQEKAGVMLNENANKIVAELKAGATLDAIASQNKLLITNPGLIKRTSQDAPEELLREAFSMAHPVSGSLVYKLSPLQMGDVVVIELSDIVDGESSKISLGAKGSFKKFLARLKGEVSLAASLANLSVDADVVIANQLAN
ncbi:MAG: peptidylprolyl isomerase [Cycloclasticus sp. symbiont of Poecilosclerida sp. M]|nr:MAG: peptidylprolyl isomerase [Cycloclasticus sp. symbiont of Poecilosclerida sp. M]